MKTSIMFYFLCGNQAASEAAVTEGIDAYGLGSTPSPAPDPLPAILPVDLNGGPVASAQRKAGGLRAFGSR